MPSKKNSEVSSLLWFEGRNKPQIQMWGKWIFQTSLWKCIFTSLLLFGLFLFGTTPGYVQGFLPLYSGLTSNGMWVDHIGVRNKI